ncbi:MAG: pantoate--beta-alanine ligase [Bacteroidales bacterium]
MNIFHKKKELNLWVEEAKKQGDQIGFVPTMGALHQGHLNLVAAALDQNHKVVCSIFVNPIQFNNPEDLKKYPRTLEQDLAMLESAGCHAVFCPTEEEIYPSPVAHEYDFGIMDKVLEGQFRPGHFNGVAIVVKRLFDIVKPHRAYFGQKDFQQLQIIRRLVAMEKIPVEVVACPTARESDGLAMSSRNRRLTPEQRLEAPRIYQILLEARKRHGQQPADEISKWVEQQINRSPLMQLEYFAIVAADTLLPAANPAEGQKVVACIAVHLDQVRLIDNLFFN